MIPFVLSIIALCGYLTSVFAVMLAIFSMPLPPWADLGTIAVVFIGSLVCSYLANVFAEAP